MLGAGGIAVVVSAGYGALLALALLCRPRRASDGDARANQFLAVALLAICLSIVLHALMAMGLTSGSDPTNLPLAAIGFLLGPLVYFHTGALTAAPEAQALWRVGRLAGRHAAVAVLALACALASRLGGWPAPVSAYAGDILQNLHILAYLAGSAWLLHRCLARSPSERTRRERAIALWVGAFLAYATAVTLAALLEVQGILPPAGSLVLPACALGGCLLTAYFWWQFPEVFAAIAPALAKRKYAKSGLRQDDADQVVERLQAVMEVERIYCNPNLTLASLAKAVHCNNVYLSQILNERLGRTFLDYVNGHRVALACERLQSLTAEHTVLDIAYGVGFNSKSTFYAAFRKAQGVTPRAYVKLQKSKAALDAGP